MSFPVTTAAGFWLFLGRLLGRLTLLATVECLGAQSADSKAPEVSVSINDSRSTEVFRGMPMLVSVILLHPDALGTNAAPILLASEQGPWTNSVSLEVSDAGGYLQIWPFNSITVPSKTIVLDSTRFAQIDRWLTPEQTLNLATGKYSLTVSVNTTNLTLPDAWKGLVESVPAEVEILDEPTPLPEAEAENKYSQLALYQLFLRNGQSALDQIDRLLTSFPTNITGLRIKSMVLDSLGRTVEAYRACEQAIAEVYARNPEPQEPPVNLFQLRQQLESKLVTPIALELTLTNEQVLLSWSAYPGLNYRLETSSDLSAWSLLTTNFTTVNNRYSFTIDLTRDRQFFRVAR